MSDALDTTDVPARARPARGEHTRAELQGEHRRRRRAGSLNRMVQFRLQIFEDGELDHDNFVYYWFNDEGNNLRRMTQLDDYEFVSVHELGASFNPESTDSESAERVRMLVGAKPDGAPLYAYLCKKPRAFWEADQEEMVRAREDMMAGRVYRAEGGWEDEERPGGNDKFYASQGNQIGHAGERRRGLVQRKL